MNRIHQSAIIGDGVDLGTDNVIGPFAVVLGPCRIGDGNWIGPHVVIGTPGELRGAHHAAAWDGDPGAGPTVIGDRNVIREFTTVQQGHAAATQIGDDCYIMTKAHVPHDGVLGDNVTVSCSVMIGGHTIVGSGANLGLGTVIHQRLVIGERAMVGMGSVVTKHIPPFALAYGNPARVRGANVVGLRRAGFDDDIVAGVDQAFGQGHDASALLDEQHAAYMTAIERATAGG